MTQRLLRLFGICLVYVLLNPSFGFGQGVDLVPNLVARPASQFSIVVDSTNGHLLLRFGATNWNNGLGPLELVAGAGTSSGQDVYQRLYRSDGTYTDIWAGTFVWHPAHDHFHFGDFARYELKATNAAPGSEQSSAKTTFCVMDTTPIDLTLTGAPSSAVYNTCGKVKQGMSVGWGDTYGPTLAGQSFDITGLPEADYDLSIITDPNNRLLEIDETDNVSCVRIHVNPGNRTVQNLGICGNVTISSLTPNTIKSGQSMNVTITGSGFAPGMAVGFENGSGSAPTIRIVNLNATTITAVVSVKNGGPKGPRYWDLRVGGTVLNRALTVNP